MKKPWWEEKAERNKVTQAVTKPNPLTPVEALRINIRKLKNELSAAREENVNLRADLVAIHSKLVEQHQKLQKAEHEAYGLRTLVDLYGLCNPDIQVARLSLEEAIDRKWMEITRQNKQKSGIPIKTVKEEYEDWEMKQFVEKMMIDKKAREAREAKEITQNQGEADETE